MIKDILIYNTKWGKEEKKFSNRTPCIQLKTVRYYYKKTNSFFFKNQRKLCTKKKYIYI